MAGIRDEGARIVEPPPTWNPSGPMLDAGPIEAAPRAAPASVVTSLDDQLAAWAATPVSPVRDIAPIDVGTYAPPRIPTVPLSSAIGDAAARGYQRGGPMVDLEAIDVVDPRALAQSQDTPPSLVDESGRPIAGRAEYAKFLAARANPSVAEAQRGPALHSTVTMLPPGFHSKPFTPEEIAGMLSPIVRGLGAGASALDFVTIAADAVIPDIPAKIAAGDITAQGSQGTLKQRYDAYIGQGLAPDVAANATMRDYGTALEELSRQRGAESLNLRGGDQLGAMAGFGGAQLARLLGLAQSVTAPAPVPGGATLPLAAGILSRGAARGITETFISQGDSVVNAITGAARKFGSQAEAAAVAERLNALGPAAFNQGVKAPLLSRIAAQANVRAQDERLLQGAAARLAPAEDLTRIFGEQLTDREGRSQALDRILELQRHKAATGGMALEDLPPITYGGGGNKPTYGFQIEKFPASVQPFMADIAQKMAPDLASLTRKMTNEDIQTAAQLIGRPVSEVAKELPKRGITSAQIQLVRQGVAAKVMEATSLATRAQMGQASPREMFSAIVSLQEAAAIQSTLHEAASEAGRALQVLRTEIDPALAENPTALAYMAAISRVAKSPENAQGIFAALQQIGNDPDAIYALLRDLNRPTVGDTLLSIWNMPRALRASLDFSAGGRQGLIQLAAHPGDVKQFYSVMWDAFRSEKFADDMARQLASGSPVRGISIPMGMELARISRRANLYQSPMGPLAKLDAREEQFLTNLLDRTVGLRGPVGKAVELAGAPYRASERAYVVPLNWLRRNRFDNGVLSLQRANGGVSDRTASTLAQWIDISTGRGVLPQRLAGLMPYLNNIFFAPRFAISRFEAFGFPVYAWAKGEREVAKMAASDMVRFVGEGTSMLALTSIAAKAAGAEDVSVESDPRSPDFGKIRVGNTTIDIWGGEQQVVRNVAQFIAGEKKTVTGKNKGQIVSVPRLDTFMRFGESKLAPAAGLVVDWMKGNTAEQRRDAEGEPWYRQPIGRDFLGNPFTAEDLLTNPQQSMFFPMAWSDIHEAANDEMQQGQLGIRTVLAGSSIFGFGVTTYDEAESGQVRAKLPRPAGVRTGGYHVLP